MSEGAKIPSGGAGGDVDMLRAQTLFSHNVCLILWLGMGLLRCTELFLGLY